MSKLRHGEFAITLHNENVCNMLATILVKKRLESPPLNVVDTVEVDPCGMELQL